MAENPEQTPDSKLNTSILYDAWARLSVYDRTATALKRDSIQKRQLIIGLTLGATIAAVLTGYSSLGNVALVPIAMIAIVLPIIASYFMNDIVKFTGTTDWIKYRYTAEMMRMHIYLYRMRAGEYGKVEPEKSDNLLVKNLATVREGINWDGVVPQRVVQPTRARDIIAVITAANHYAEGDDGISPIDIENFIRWRVDNQIEWYDSKMLFDFDKRKQYYRWSQSFLAVSAVVGVLALGVSSVAVVSLIAITNAISAAFVAWSDAGMYGTTYGVFMITSHKLKDAKLDWKSRANDPEMQNPETRTQQIAEFAHQVENILLWEREEWYELVLQAQAASDKVIMEDLKRLTQRADKAEHQDING